jgi:hypothetical protein
MAVVLRLPPETERLLQEKACRRGQSLERYLEELAMQEAQQSKENPAVPVVELPAERWVAELRAWAASHRRLDTLADDSRESIYEGRGE